MLSLQVSVPSQSSIRWIGTLSGGIELAMRIWLPEVPKDTRGLDIERAYRELHEVSYSHVEPNTCSFFWMTVKHSDVVLYCIDSVISECD